MIKIILIILKYKRKIRYNNNNNNNKLFTNFIKMTSLPDMVKDITYFYIKYFYEKQLKDTNQKILSEIDLKNMIENLYIEKATELKKYIRDTLKDNLKENYSSFSVENIILEMFSDPTFSKHRVFLEIMEYQKQ